MMKYIFLLLIHFNAADPNKDAYKVINDVIKNDSVYNSKYADVYIKDKTIPLITSKAECHTLLQELLKHNIDTSNLCDTLVNLGITSLQQENIDMPVKLIDKYEFTRPLVKIVRNKRGKIIKRTVVPAPLYEKKIYYVSLPYFINKEYCLISVYSTAGYNSGSECIYLMRYTKGWKVVESLYCKMA